MSARLLDGNRRFRRRYWPSRKDRLRALTDGQKPLALYLGCADSRVVPNVFLDAEPGELFVVRQIAAIVPSPKSAAARPLAAALEYAIEQLSVRHVIVCGHDQCGGLAGLLDREAGSHSHLTEWLDEAAVDEVLRDELASMPRTRAVERFVGRQARGAVDLSAGGTRAGHKQPHAARLGLRPVDGPRARPRRRRPLPRAAAA